MVAQISRKKMVVGDGGQFLENCALEFAEIS